MRYFYAQINPDGLCTGTLDTHKRITKPSMIEISQGENPLEQLFNGVSFDPVPKPTHRTRIKGGQIMALLRDPENMSKGSYAKIFRSAYPQGNKDEDDVALEFLEQAKNPYSTDGLIEVSDLTEALDYFITKGYMDTSDKERVLLGWAT